MLPRLRPHVHDPVGVAHDVQQALLRHDDSESCIVLGGDIFDFRWSDLGSHDDSLKQAQDWLEHLINHAGQAQVVFLPGNHDCLYTGAIYDRHDFSRACDNVQVITDLNGQVIELPELDTVIWGRAMEEHEPGFHGLENVALRDDAGELIYSPSSPVSSVFSRRVSRPSTTQPTTAWPSP